MALRKPDADLPCPVPLAEVANKLDQNPWHQMECQLITPLYGGGVESATVDVKMPIRVTSIRGQLRFWWRFLAKNLWKLGSAAEIRKAEFALWGGMGKEAHASEVLLRVSGVSEPKVGAYRDYSHTENPKNPDRPTPLELAYVFFPADNETDQSVSHDLIQEGLAWTLHFRFGGTLVNDASRQQQVLQTLRWWGQFGGLGFRSRRGTGAVWVNACADFPEIATPLADEEVAATGCLWEKRAAKKDAIGAWKDAVGKMRDFRQKANLGRNPTSAPPKPAGQSRWPEPDAIRRLQKMAAPLHEPKHLAGNIFPRGFFGLPIIFHFVGKGEPGDTQLSPVGKERMPSRVLLRPVSNGQGLWMASALVLPYDDLFDLPLELGGKGRSQAVKMWDAKAANLIKPIQEHGGSDPIKAFLNHFKK